MLSDHTILVINVIKSSITNISGWYLTNNRNTHRLWAFVNIVCKIIKIDWRITSEESNELVYKNSELDSQQSFTLCVS